MRSIFKAIRKNWVAGVDRSKPPARQRGSSAHVGTRPQPALAFFFVAVHSTDTIVRRTVIRDNKKPIGLHFGYKRLKRKP
jgi:hypothetical protein